MFNYKPYVIWQQFSLQMIFFHLNKLRRRHSSKGQNDQIEAGSHHLGQKQLFLPQCLALFHRLLPDRPLLPLVTDRLLSCMVVGTQSCKLGAKGLTTYTVQLMLVWCPILILFFFFVLDFLDFEVVCVHMQILRDTLSMIGLLRDMCV